MQAVLKRSVALKRLGRERSRKPIVDGHYHTPLWAASRGLAMSTELTISPGREQHPAPLFTPTPQAAKRMLEFFTAQINNAHTRRAYMNVTRRFAA